MAQQSLPVRTYATAGAVVIDSGGKHVLVLLRPSRLGPTGQAEVRLRRRLGGLLPGGLLPGRGARGVLAHGLGEERRGEDKGQHDQGQGSHDGSPTLWCAGQWPRCAR